MGRVGHGLLTVGAGFVGGSLYYSVYFCVGLKSSNKK